MTSHYTIAQYVPDPTADERMNIGVIVWEDGRVYSDFILDFARARSFGGKDITFLKDFAGYVRNLTNEKRDHYAEFSPDRIGKLINSWTDSIQFTEPRGSTKSATELIEELPSRFLRRIQHLSPSIVKITRTRAQAVRAAYKSVRDAVKAQAPDKARHLVQKNLSLPGKFNRHVFDIGLVNGHPFAAVNAISFGLTNRGQLQKEIDATAWIFDDVRMKTADLPLAVYIAHAPQDDDSLFDETAKTFRGLKAKVISQDRDMMRWAATQVQNKGA
jgi:hypothetical protein